LTTVIGLRSLSQGLPRWLGCVALTPNSPHTRNLNRRLGQGEVTRYNAMLDRRDRPGDAAIEDQAYSRQKRGEDQSSHTEVLTEPAANAGLCRPRQPVRISSLPRYGRKMFRPCRRHTSTSSWSSGTSSSATGILPGSTISCESASARRSRTKSSSPP